MRAHFPTAKSFGATRRYWLDAASTIRHEQAVTDRKKQEFIDQEVEEAKTSQDKADMQRWQEQWDQLPAEQQQAIRDITLTLNARLKLDKHPLLLHRFCLRELGKRERTGHAA